MWRTNAPFIQTSFHGRGLGAVACGLCFVTVARGSYQTDIAAKNDFIFSIIATESIYGTDLAKVISIFNDTLILFFPVIFMVPLHCQTAAMTLNLK